MTFNDIANKILSIKEGEFSDLNLKEGDLGPKNHNRILPLLGEIVSKVNAPEDDRREYVVVGVVPQGIWIYNIVNPDFENQNAELVFSKELVGYES